MDPGSFSLATHSLHFRGLDIYVFDQPATKLTKEAIFDDVIEVVAQARGWTTAEEHASIRATYKFQPFLEADRVFIVARGTQAIGFCSVRFLESGPNRIHHLSNAAIIPELQSQGLMAYLSLVYPGVIDNNRDSFLDGIKQGRQFFTFISQSPVVYGGFSRGGKLYPALDGSAAPDDVKGIAKLIAQTINPHLKFDPERLVIRKECSFFYRDVPRHRRPEVNQFMDNLLDYAAGDVIVGVLQLAPQAVQDALLHYSSPGSAQ
jgi:hypothetical protein